MSLKIEITVTDPSPEELEYIAAFLVSRNEPGRPVLIQPPSAPVHTSADPEPDPAAVFGKPEPVASSPEGVETLTLAGPSVTIPQPPPSGPTAVLSGGVTFDKNGLPWDERIHASSKAFNADGSWRQKRGVIKELVPSVESELRAVLAIPPPPPPPVAAAPIAPPPPTSEANLQEAFIKLVGDAAMHRAAGRLNESQIQKCLDVVGVPSMPMLGLRLDLVPHVAAMMDGIIAGRSV